MPNRRLTLVSNPVHGRSRGPPPGFYPLARRTWGGVNVPQGDVMGLWLLSFTEHEVAIIVEAETLTHARLLAAANQVCRASQFDEGWAINRPCESRSRRILSDEPSRKMKQLICSAR